MLLLETMKMMKCIVKCSDDGNDNDDDDIFHVSAANRYTLPQMIGSTVQSGKRQAPCYSLRGRTGTGSFAEDLARVSALDH